MIKLTFSPGDIDIFNYERYHHPHPHVQRKMEALWLKSQGLSHNEICRLTDLSGDTLRCYLRAYQEGGVERLKMLPFYRRQSALADHRPTIEAEFRACPPASIKEAQARIETLTGIRRSENRVREYLTSLGIKRYKIGLIPAKADVEEQATFKKNARTPPEGGTGRGSGGLLCRCGPFPLQPHRRLPVGFCAHLLARRRGAPTL